MRRPFVAGNWKMNLTRDESTALASEIVSAVGSGGNCDVAVCPPNVYLHAVAEATKGSSVGVGAQNVYHEVSGAFTGETSTEMIKDVGATYVILGHSERRHVLGESDEVVNRKMKAALAAGLQPILCVGESQAERESNDTEAVLSHQVLTDLAEVHTSDLEKVVIAYEPVWAIGTGLTASPEQAQEACEFIRNLLRSRDEAKADQVRILYGGSVKPGNAEELLALPDIDGALVGGAALDPDDFGAIIAAAPSE